MARLSGSDLDMTRPLSNLFLGERAADHPVALAAGGVRTWEAFRQAVAQVALHAERAGGGRWVLACEDAWDFAAGFFGLLAAGRVAVLPPNFQPETLAHLAQQAEGILRALPRDPAPPLDESRPLAGTAEFWTSGTTGEPKAVVKSLRQLEAEVVELETLFGSLLRGAAGPVVGTVPHQHIYGFLFRILWPLAAGRTFLIEPCGDPAGFRGAVAQSPVLVSSPAHLSRLPRLMDFSELPGWPQVVFSSGGPLNREDALVWRRWVPAGVTEIYGSTETGGIAWRNQEEAPESELWTPFTDVDLTRSEDGALVVNGFRAGPRPLRMEDGVAFAPRGRFRLLGRLDRTIKLEEKRVSLPELEMALESHPQVLRAAVVLLPGRRPALGAVVVLREPLEQDRLQRVEALRGHLAGRFEPVALPRRWRFVDALPYDGRGKLTAQALSALFLETPQS